MPVQFYSIKSFVEDVGRREVYRFGDTTTLVCIYTGPADLYSQWNPQIGSSHPQYPLMLLTNIQKNSLAGVVLEVTLSYTGTELVGVTYTDLKITTDLLMKSFSWSGVAFIPYYNTTTSPTFLANFSTEIQYWTKEVTFSYTTFTYQPNALFASQAGKYIGVTASYFQSTIGTNIQPGVYTGVPTVHLPLQALQQLTRFSSQQDTPQNQQNRGIWKNTESWEMTFNMGSLGFSQIV